MWFVQIVQCRNNQRELVAEFVCENQSRANFLAGQKIDELTDFTGLKHDYSVRPVEVEK